MGKILEKPVGAGVESAKTRSKNTHRQRRELCATKKACLKSALFAENPQNIRSYLQGRTDF